MTSTSTTAAVALAPYGLDPRAVEELPSGNNDILRVSTADGDVVVRIHRPGYRSERDVSTEIQYLEAINAAGTARAPVPIRTTDGSRYSLLATARGQRIVTVLRWIPGRVLRPGSGAGPVAVRRIGAALGALHEISANLAPGVVDQPASLAPSVLLPPYLDYVSDTDHRQMIDEVIIRSETLFASVPMTADHRGLIHNDVIFSNCVHRGDETALIDFDDCGWGTYLQDLGSMLENVSGERNAEALRDELLAGYESLRPLPSRDPFVLDSMIALRHAWATAWSYGRAAAGDFTADRMAVLARHRMGWVRSFLRVG